MTRKSPTQLKKLLSPKNYAALLLTPDRVAALLRQRERQTRRAMARVVRHSRYAAGGRTQHERERLRRIRQIVAGRLTVSNGLVLPCET